MGSLRCLPIEGFHRPPYAAVLVYCIGSFISNILFNTYLMSHPTRGEKVTYSDYFPSGRFKCDAIGVLGGVSMAWVSRQTSSPRRRLVRPLLMAWARAAQ